MFGEQNNSASLGAVSTQPIVFSKCDTLRMLLNEIASKLQPVLHEGMGAAKTTSEKPSSPVALQRELDGLIEMAVTLKDSIVL